MKEANGRAAAAEAAFQLEKVTTVSLLHRLFELNARLENLQERTDQLGR